MKESCAHPAATDAPAGSTTGGLGRSALTLVAVIFALTLVRAAVAASTGLTDDEAYYRLWALAPAMGYFDHPPMVGWMIAAGRWVAGDSTLAIRLCGMLISLLGPLVLWRTTHLLFGPEVARRAVWISLAMPLLAVGGIIMTPDTPSVLFWGLSAWALAELHTSRNANWWLAVGAFAGLGLLSKYSNLFVGASILLWLLLVPANRVWFRSWQLWAGGMIACLVASPVVIWNAQHEWMSFAKQFGRVAQGKQLTATYFAEMIGAFMGLASPIIAVLALCGLGVLVRAAVSARTQASAMVVAGALPLLMYFLLHSLHGRVQPNWLAPIYPSLAVCAAIGLARLEGLQDGRFGILGRCALGLGFLLSGVIYLHALRPLAQVAALKDPSAQMHGWRQMAGEIERLRVSTGSCWVTTSSYATTGQLAYALRGSMTSVAQLNERHRYFHLPAIDNAILGCPALHVELTRRSSEAMLREHFQTVSFVATLARWHAGATVANYTIYLVAGPRTDIRSLRAGIVGESTAPR